MLPLMTIRTATVGSVAWVITGLRVRGQAWWSANRQSALCLQQLVDQPPGRQSDVVVGQRRVLGNVANEFASFGGADQEQPLLACDVGLFGLPV